MPVKSEKVASTVALIYVWASVARLCEDGGTRRASLSLDRLFAGHPDLHDRAALK